MTAATHHLEIIARSFADHLADATGCRVEVGGWADHGCPDTWHIDCFSYKSSVRVLFTPIHISSWKYGTHYTEFPYDDPDTVHKLTEFVRTKLAEPP